MVHLRNTNHFFFAKLSLRLLAKMAAMAKLTSPLLFLSSWTQASLGKPMAIMLAISLSFTLLSAAAPEACEGAGPGVAALLDLDSLVSILLSDADLRMESFRRGEETFIIFFTLRWPPPAVCPPLPQPLWLSSSQHPPH